MPDPGKTDEGRAVSLAVPGKDPPKLPEEEEGEPYGVPPKRKWYMSHTEGLIVGFLCTDPLGL